MTPEIVRDLIHYNEDTGDLIWKERDRSYFKSDRDFKRWNTRYSGKLAITSINSEGYKTGFILKHPVKAHRIAWIIKHGKPPLVIDHVNGDRSDNRIENLREVSSLENSKNRKLQKNNKSGVSGVYFCNRTKLWVSCISDNGVQKIIGYFNDKLCAVSARIKAESDLKYHPNHGRRA